MRPWHLIIPYFMFSMASIAQSNISQSNFIKLDGNSQLNVPYPTNDPRVFIQLDNKSTNGSSVVSINLNSGLKSSTTALQHIGREFNWPTPQNPFAGFGQVYSRDRGLIIRTGSPENLDGVIKFMTGSASSNYGYAERVRIASNGNLGVGTDNPKSKLQVTDGDVFIENPNRGIIMKDANGSCWRITVGTTGSLISTSIACP